MTGRLEVPADSQFPLESLPYGVFSSPGETPRVGVAIGDHVLDLAGLAADGLLGDDAGVFGRPSLNAFMAQGRTRWREVRARLQDLLAARSRRRSAEPWLRDRADLTLHLPFAVADYVDFYSSLDHAQNLGRMFRPGQEPLSPNWRHLPVGYHGRSGTVAVSGTPVLRPSGQRKSPGDPGPTFGPSRRLDIEAEVGFVVGVPSAGAVPADAVRDHVFGVVLVNDWSARDLQAWEYVPLGPFLGKSFLTSVSPWVVPLDALGAALVEPPAQEPAPLPYLRPAVETWGLDLALEVRLNGTVISRPPFRGMYWTPAQQLAHLTVNGAGLRTGDLFASGTVSGPQAGQRGSLIELTWNGTEPLHLPDGSTRAFLEDGDEVTITGTAPGPDGTRIGLGEVTGTVRS